MAYDYVVKLLNEGQQYLMEYKDYKDYFYELLKKIINRVFLLGNKQQMETFGLGKIPNLIKGLDKNIGLSNNELANLLTLCFYNIHRNKNVDAQEKNEIINRYLSTLVFQIYFDNNCKMEIFEQAIFSIAKESIRKNYRDNFGYLVSELYKHVALRKTEKPDPGKYILSVISVYLFYASLKEELFSIEFRQEISGFLDLCYFSDDEKIVTQYSLRNFIINSRGYLWNWYSEIKEQLENYNWEYVHDVVVKQKIIGRAVDEFFVYYSIAFCKNTSSIKSKLRELDSNTLARLLMYLTSEGQLKENYRGDYEVFCKWLKCSDDQFAMSNNGFHKLLSSIYKQSVLNELVEQDDSWHKLSKDKEAQIMEELKARLQHIPFSSNKVNGNCRVKVDETIPVPVKWLIEENMWNLEALIDGFVPKIERYIASVLERKCVEFVFDLKMENEAIRLKKFLDDLQAKEQLEINAYFNFNIFTGSRLKYYGVHNENMILKTIVEKLEYLGELYGLPENVVLDRNKIKTRIDLIALKIRDLNKDEVKARVAQVCKSEGGCLFPEDKALGVKATEEEIECYFKYGFKVLEIEYRLKIETEYPCGVIIEIK